MGTKKRTTFGYRWNSNSINSTKMWLLVLWTRRNQDTWETHYLYPAAVHKIPI